RHDLRIAAAGRPALHAEYRPERRLAQADHRLLADVIQRIAEADGRGGLAFARRRRADGRNEDELAVLLPLEALEVVERHLGLVVAIGLQMLVGNAKLLARYRRDALQPRC